MDRGYERGQAKCPAVVYFALLGFSPDCDTTARCRRVGKGWSQMVSGSRSSRQDGVVSRSRLLLNIHAVLAI